MHEKLDGLVQDCCHFIAIALELLQFCTEPSNYVWFSLFTTNSLSYHFIFNMKPGNGEAPYPLFHVGFNYSYMS